MKNVNLGTEDRCEPLLIPSVIAGFDRDWVAIAPLAIPHWDRLLLEPFSKPRDIAFKALAPDSEFFLCTYSGQHVPITEGLWLMYNLGVISAGIGHGELESMIINKYAPYSI